VNPATRLAALIGIVAALAACGPGATPSAGPIAPSGASRDLSFALTVALDRPTYRAGQAIQVTTAYTYLGPKGGERVFHASSPVGFRIEEIGGRRGMEGGMDMPCLSTDVTAGQPVAVGFFKSGGISQEPGVGFDLAWFQDPVLSLPAGQWRIIARLDANLGDCGGESHALETSIDIRVEP
jgi:hypothetical protein